MCGAPGSLVGNGFGSEGRAGRVRSAETVVVLVALATVVAAFAGRLRVPAPSLLVVAGLVAGLLPRVPQVHVPPAVVSLVVLPPLLWRPFGSRLAVNAVKSSMVSSNPRLPRGRRQIEQRVCRPSRGSVQDDGILERLAGQDAIGGDVVLDQPQDLLAGGAQRSRFVSTAGVSAERGRARPSASANTWPVLALPMNWHAPHVGQASR